MSDAGLVAKDPELLVEAARVFNAAGREYRTAAELVAEMALKAVQNLSSDDKKDPKKQKARRAAYGDAAALRLSGRVPGGYQAALGLLNAIIDTEKDPDPDGRLHLLRALAKGQSYKDLRSKDPHDPQLKDLRDQIHDDLAAAFQRHYDLFKEKDQMKKANRHFWQPEPGQVDEDDLKLAYEDAKANNEALATLLD
jgi:hypothetical protein